MRKWLYLLSAMMFLVVSSTAGTSDFLDVKEIKAAKGSTHTIYRVVSKSEAADVLANGFRQAPISSKISSYEGKLFWSNLDDANWFKSWKGADDVILKMKVNNSFMYENGYDAGRLFYYVSPDRMGTFNSAIKVIK